MDQLDKALDGITVLQQEATEPGTHEGDGNNGGSGKGGADKTN